MADQLHSNRNIETSINSVAEWIFDIELKLDFKDMTEFMNIASRRNYEGIYVDHLDLEGEIIKQLEFLVLSLTAPYPCLYHVNHVRKFGFYRLNWIKPIRNCLTDDAVKAIVHDLIKSHAMVYSISYQVV